MVRWYVRSRRLCRNCYWRLTPACTEFATQTPYILSLGVPATFTTWTWAAGAVTGFVVQPIVGSFSDRYAACGCCRRRHCPCSLATRSHIALQVREQVWPTTAVLGLGRGGYCVVPTHVRGSVASFPLLNRTVMRAPWCGFLAAGTHGAIK